MLRDRQGVWREGLVSGACGAIIRPILVSTYVDFDVILRACK